MADECGMACEDLAICNNPYFQKWLRVIHMKVHPLIRHNKEEDEDEGVCEECEQPTVDPEDRLCHCCYHKSCDEGECWCGC